MKLIAFFIILFITLSLYSQNEDYLKGYERTIQGEELVYESLQPDAGVSLLVRSLDSNLFIEWETQFLPLDYTKDTAVFVWIAGIDVNLEDPHIFKMYINGEKSFTFSNPLNDSFRCFSWKSNNMRLEYKGISLDKYADFMGYMYLHIPTKLLIPGEPVNLKVVGESANSRSWFMIFKYACRNYIDLIAENAIINTQEGPGQQLKFSISYLGNEIKARIKIGDVDYYKIIPTGYSTLRIPIPMVEVSTQIPVLVEVGDNILFEEDFIVNPANFYEVHLIHHSHVDIGYTHIQEEVEEMQWDYLDQAIELDKKNINYPPEARIKWNVEVMWAVESYFRKATQEKRDAFRKAVKNGTIELDALYGNGLLALCNEEELFRMTESARVLADECNIELTSAMITDIPGWTWGIIPVLAKSGVKYFSIGTNHAHRIGSIIKAWGDKPFYWVSNSGNDSVLCWIHQKGYALFHAGLNRREVNYNRFEDLILGYINSLKKSSYPYEIVPLRYNIGSDNGPIDTTLSDFVMDWNERYISPKLIISTVDETFHQFENKYGTNIPSFKGDITAYWEDGAASTAKETKINRASAERLVQAETLWSLINPEQFPEKEFTRAWQKVMLYDEHTWGAHNSISEPEVEFVKHQWKVKKQFAIDGQNLSENLINQAINKVEVSDTIQTFTVYNTESWNRTDLVTIEQNPILTGKVVIDEDSNQMLSQLKSDGSLVFLAEDIPAMGSKKYYLKEGNAIINSEIIVLPNTIENSYLKVLVDEKTGVITGVIDKISGINIVKIQGQVGFNQYFYVNGRSPENPLTNSQISIRIGERGPLISSLIIESMAPGCRALKSEIMLVEGLNRLEIINTLDKENIYNPEGLHFAFPFNVPDGVMRISMPFGYYRPEEDQLPGSNKNYYTLRRWVDISNQDYGITWISPDAPLIELNQISTDPISFGWIDHIQPSDIFYSYVMNNYWETNFKASQDGKMSFRYYIISHNEFNSTFVEKEARGITRPFIVTYTDGPIPDQLFSIENKNILLGSIKPVEDNAFIIRFFNSSDSKEELKIKWIKKPQFYYECDPDGKELKGSEQLTTFLPFDTRFFMVRF